ncbi:MAG: pyridoxamine 5'-phosphate oxidase family protein [Pseudomonadota bacterium]
MPILTPSPKRHPAMSDAVRAMQEAKGSRADYARIEARGPRADLTPALRTVLAETRSLYLATASADGQPYVQHRGGPPGFVTVLADTRLAFADYAGNAQYVSAGNLTENPRVQLFVMDYMRQRRVKLWGTARMVEADSEELAPFPTAEGAVVERAFVMDVTQWDMNCHHHIPQRFEAEDVTAKLAERDARIRALEAQVKVLEQKAWLREGCAGAGDFD